jgi:hypothetical protein
MLKTRLIWKAEEESAFSAQLGNLIIYHAITQTDGYTAYVEILRPDGVVKRLNLGLYRTMDQAMQACERQRRATLCHESSTNLPEDRHSLDQRRDGVAIHAR